MIYCILFHIYTTCILYVLVICATCIRMSGCVTRLQGPQDMDKVAPEFAHCNILRVHCSSTRLWLHFVCIAWQLGVGWQLAWCRGELAKLQAVCPTVGLACRGLQLQSLPLRQVSCTMHFPTGLMLCCQGTGQSIRLQSDCAAGFTFCI